MSSKLHIKSGDTVRVIAGDHKGSEAKILRTDPRNGLVFVEGIGIVKRHVKPNQLNPRGGTKEVHIGLDVSKVKKIADEAPVKKTKKEKN